MSNDQTPETIDGADLLDRVEAAVLRYVYLPSPAALVAVVLWIAATHAQPAWAHAPRLVIRGPEKRCGKSRLLDVVEAQCWAPFITVNSSPAAVYRSVTDDPPTLLVDEADTIFGPKADANEDLRGLFNAGHQRNRPAKRYDAAADQVQSIPTFAMAALAGIGVMPDTIEDRAVIVRMRRRGPGETVAPFRHRRDRPVLRALAAELNAWLRANLTVLEAAEPVMPVEDRAADTWEPLFAVADLAGGHWPARAHDAVLALQAEVDEAAAEQASDRVRLLMDVHRAFGDATAMPTALLLRRLCEDPEAPWGEYGTSGLTARKLGVLLAGYGVRSATIRFTEGQAKGYQRADFLDPWSRYTPHLLDTAPDTPEGGSRPIRTNLESPGQSGTDSNPGTDRPVPGNRPVPGLTCENDVGTDGTGNPPQLRVVGDR